MPNTITNILMAVIRSELSNLISGDVNSIRSKLITALINKQITDTMPAKDPHLTNAEFLFLKRLQNQLTRTKVVIPERIFMTSRSTIGKGLLRAIAANLSDVGAIPSQRRTTIKVMIPKKACIKAAMPATF